MPPGTICGAVGVKRQDLTTSRKTGTTIIYDLASRFLPNFLLPGKAQLTEGHRRRRFAAARVFTED